MTTREQRGKVIPISKLSDKQKPRTAKLGRDIQARIGEQLRAMYNGLVEQPVPDRFVELLKRLDSRQQGAKPEPDATRPPGAAPQGEAK